MNKPMTFVKTSADILTAVDAEGDIQEFEIADIQDCVDDWVDFNNDLIEDGDDITPPLPADALQNDVNAFLAAPIESIPSPPVPHDRERVGLFGNMRWCRDVPLVRLPKPYIKGD